MIKELSEQCLKKLQKQYGDNPPSWIVERLEKELALIAAKGSAEKFLQVAEFTQKDCAEGHLNWACGTAADSFVSYLLGITECNPLPAHYLCTDCHYTELAKSIDHWPDLPDQLCPHCGKPMKKDGFHLPYECFLGYPGQEAELHFELRVAHAELEDRPFQDLGYMRAVPTAWIRILHQLAIETGVSLDTVPQDESIAERLMESDIFKKFQWEQVREVIELTKPKTFSDLVQVCNATNGAGTLMGDAWAKMVLKLLQQNIASLQEIPVYREDVFAYLTQKGMSQADAHWYMDHTYRGGFHSNMPDDKCEQLCAYGVPKWYIDSMKSITYLPTKAHTIGYLLLLYRLAWYEHHYPDAYEHIMDTTNH